MGVEANSKEQEEDEAAEAKADARSMFKKDDEDNAALPCSNEDHGVLVVLVLEVLVVYVVVAVVVILPRRILMG